MPKEQRRTRIVDVAAVVDVDLSTGRKSVDSGRLDRN